MTNIPSDARHEKIVSDTKDLTLTQDTTCSTAHRQLRIRTTVSYDMYNNEWSWTVVPLNQECNLPHPRFKLESGSAITVGGAWQEAQEALARTLAHVQEASQNRSRAARKLAMFQLKNNIR